MKSRLIFIFFCLTLFYSCQKDPKFIPVKEFKEQLDTFLIVGSNDASIKYISTIIKPPDRCKNRWQEIDINSDSINDIAIEVSYCFSPAYYYGDININCLGTRIKVLTNDSRIEPKVLNKGDTISFHKNWRLAKRMYLVNSYRYNQIIGGDGIEYNVGAWYGLSDRYIGLLIENDGNPIYAWLKISIPTGYSSLSANLHEVGYKKLDY
jgi:hypothetical protein